MTSPKISKGYRKYIRQEKARIRQKFLDPKEQEIKIKELYTSVLENLKSLKTKSNV
jgi:hypothetical protein